MVVRRWSRAVGACVPSRRAAANHARERLGGAAPPSRGWWGRPPRPPPGTHSAVAAKAVPAARPCSCPRTGGRDPRATGGEGPVRRVSPGGGGVTAERTLVGAVYTGLTSPAPSTIRSRQTHGSRGATAGQTRGRGGSAAAGGRRASGFSCQLTARRPRGEAGDSDPYVSLIGACTAGVAGRPCMRRVGWGNAAT